MQLHKMPSESKPLLTAQTEKPNHYSYLKEFRVEQCPLFLQHKCTQHRPFTCFHWHFMNQRRRRPVRKRDGSFNYSADNYCTKYDETTGLCPEGDECPFLHRTAGDTERRYHLRYYKTCMCVHDTDARGFCAKNGPHCAFAHGNHDLRPPVYDIKEIQALENPDGEGNASSNGPNVLDKERNLMNEDPKWQDTNYVLSSYKTEPCKRPPRLCRQGYACPQFHNSRDKRRSPRKFKYRSTPCPNVKHGDEWGEPGNCDSGDMCGYCHTRTEQQFHPEIYKSTKCNDVQQAGYCPRGVFCAFAHVDQEMSIARELAAPLDIGTNLADILSNALPAQQKRDQKSSESSEMIKKQMLAVDNDPLLDPVEKAQRKQSLYLALSMSNHNQINNQQTNTQQHQQSSSLIPMSPLGNHFYSSSIDPIESVVGNPLDDLHLDEQLGLVASIDRDYETGSPTTVSNSISAGLASSGLLGSSAPVNIPGSSNNSLAGQFSPSASSPLHHLHSGFLSASRFSHQEPLDTVQRLREELAGNRSKLASWEERISQARGACEAWQREAEDANRKANIAEQQRDEAVSQAKALQQEVDLLQGSPYLHGLRRISELRNLSLATLKSLQAQLRSDLEEIDKVLYLQTATKCMVCEERNRSVTLGPCNHFVMCSTCAPTQKNCPYCQTPIIAHSTTTSASSLQT